MAVQTEAATKTTKPQSQTSWGRLYASFCTILHDHNPNLYYDV
jgi:hypothetical protein